MNHNTPLPHEQQPPKVTVFSGLVLRTSTLRRCVCSAVAGSLVLGGCGTSGPLTRQVSCASTALRQADPVITATATSAELAPSLTSAALDILRSLAADGDRCVDLMSPDGAVEALPLTPHRGAEVEHGPRRLEVLEHNLTVVQQHLATLAARTPGLDTLGLLQRAARRTRPGGLLIVITSGLSTTDPVDVRRLGWDLDAGTVMAFLAAERELPDLAGRQVLLSGIGSVTGAQPSLRQGLRSRLAALWAAVCRVSRARSCTVDTAEPDPVPPTARNAVPVVPLPAVPAPPAAVGTLPLPAAALFALDSAELGPEAEQRLRPIADRLRDDEVILRVRGCTDASTGTAEHNRRLSQERADAVVDALARLGVPRQRMAPPVGAGACGATREQEQARPELVAAHRRVELTFTR